MPSLVDRIEAARAAYYAGHPIMDDATYDALEDQLRAQDPQHPLLAKVGASPVGGAWPKVQHAIPMGSLNKAQVETEMQAWYRFCGNGAVVRSDKCDGLSVALEYIDRRLTQALTRGDGMTGEDITRNVLLMQGAVKVLPPTLPNGLPTPSKVYVRGEIVVRLGDFEQHFHGDSNPRSTAAGTARRQSSGYEQCAYLTILAYQFLPEGIPLPTKAEEFQTLGFMGFQIPKWTVLHTQAEIQTDYLGYVSTVRKSLDYMIDGLVLDLNDRNTRENLGEADGRPKGSIAYKFPHEQRPTKMLDIEWQVGNSGRVTPVAIFEPVLLGGKSVTHASLAGVRQVEHLKLYKGCTILVSLRNDVIPRIESNLDLGIENDM